MPRPPLQPPAWYADRSNASALRYWDGRRWTGRWRPPPGWAGARHPSAAEPEPDARPPGPPTPPAPPPGGPGARARAVRRAHRLALASAAALAAAAVLGAVVTLGTHENVARISDAAFVRSANGACAAALDPLRRERRPGRLGSGARAARIDRLASTLSGLASQLGTIPVQDADRPAVQAWLASWGDYTTIARSLAASVRNGDGRSSSLGSQANVVDVRLQVFARANGIERCVF